MDSIQRKELERLAIEIRIGTIEEFKARGFGHIGGALSIVDALAVLYGSEMSVDTKNPDKPDRDKLVCSKGHAGPSVYAALALKGFFPYEELKTLNQPGTNLPSHCDRNKTCGIDMTTGSLGQGTSLAVGIALGDMLKGRENRVFLFVGDGELNEGQVWEAAMLASARKLSNMIWFIDENKKQLDGFTSEIMPLADIAGKFEAFGFNVQRIDGNDVEAIYEAIQKTKTVKGKPHAIILDTVKGAGIPDVENTLSNHSMTVSPEQCDKWITVLKEELDAIDVHRR